MNAFSATLDAGFINHYFSKKYHYLILLKSVYFPQQTIYLIRSLDTNYTDLMFNSWLMASLFFKPKCYDYLIQKNKGRSSVGLFDRAISSFN